jgi:hypothetical protein
MLVIIAPPEADCFSFAVACIPSYGASQRQMKIKKMLSDLCVSSTAQNGTGGECILNFFTKAYSFRIQSQSFKSSLGQWMLLCFLWGV